MPERRPSGPAARDRRARGSSRVAPSDGGPDLLVRSTFRGFGRGFGASPLARRSAAISGSVSIRKSPGRSAGSLIGPIAVRRSRWTKWPARKKSWRTSWVRPSVTSTRHQVEAPPEAVLRRSAASGLTR
ncbi:MAG: hypothetical protein MUC56_12420, partial [Thermoanaerobaculales bacterium]|nr:hypothetical protein [Thermoanaerobaculales bacterium]